MNKLNTSLGQSDKNEKNKDEFFIFWKKIAKINIYNYANLSPKTENM